jgi:hypothetical protein
MFNRFNIMDKNRGRSEDNIKMILKDRGSEEDG